MNETVKLIIEIPKDIYERCKEYKLWSYDAETLEGAVATSKPLSENKGDLISRQAVEDVIYDYSRSCDVNYAQIMEYIDKIPFVENKGEWIPANVPPKESGRYLTYIVNEYDEKLQYIMTADYVARPTPIDGLSPWNVDDECASDNVVAWQPLPEPYKTESGDMKKRCITCKNNDDELSGECYECLKGMFDHYEAESEGV